MFVAENKLLKIFYFEPAGREMATMKHNKFEMEKGTKCGPRKIHGIKDFVIINGDRIDQPHYISIDLVHNGQKRASFFNHRDEKLDSIHFLVCAIS